MAVGPEKNLLVFILNPINIWLSRIQKKIIILVSYCILFKRKQNGTEYGLIKAKTYRMLITWQSIGKIFYLYTRIGLLIHLVPTFELWTIK